MSMFEHIEMGTAENLRACARLSDKAGRGDEATRLRAAARVVDDAIRREQEAKHALSCMAASRDRWKAEAMGKITPEWRAIYEAGAKPIEG